MPTFRTRITIICTLVLALGLPSVASARGRDGDRDRMPDRWERQNGLNTHRNDAAGDKDRDGLTNRQEFRSKTNPRDADSDNDSIGDADEDRDRDHVDNGNEGVQGTNPSARDSDHDRVSDGDEDPDHDGLSNADEDATGNSPVDPDSDGDGTDDGAESVGRIVSFTDSKLVVALANGDTLTGTVTDGTEIGCQDEDGYEDSNDKPATATAASRDEDEDESDDDDEPGRDDESEDEDDEAGERDCGVESLTAGTAVHEATLTMTSEGLVFDELELVG